MAKQEETRCGDYNLNDILKAAERLYIAEGRNEDLNGILKALVTETDNLNKKVSALEKEVAELKKHNPENDGK
ncbi:MAG: hypothetical protein Q7R73_05385 [bacterium]|nr:hypothetical protein [bacterium]